MRLEVITYRLYRDFRCNAGEQRHFLFQIILGKATHSESCTLTRHACDDGFDR